MSEVRLTEYSHGAGCACKLSPVELATILDPIRGHPATKGDGLIVGLDVADDSGVFSLGDGRALVQSVDIFTPVVDDPYDWGRIAATNALSDIYAMGARPITALNYLAWPRDTLDFGLSTPVLQGGLDVMSDAGVVVIGGHSVDSPEPSFGFAVTGLADEDAVVTLSGAQVDDALVLTKPIGIGVITTAIKREMATAEVAARAIATMTTLNDRAGAALGLAHAATDITGFGLLGHTREMIEASGVGARLEAREVPVLDGARELLAKGAWAGGSNRNLEAVRGSVESAVDDLDLRLLADAQTSGGLLAAVPPESVAEFLDIVPGACVIGTVVASTGIQIV